MRFVQRDITIDDPSFDATTDSLSCLHALEHVGLGRYGDQLDVNGWLKAWSNLVRMVQPGGRLYLSTPIGPQRVEFNAHRVFAVRTLVDLLDESCDIESFAYIDDDGNMHTDVDISDAAAANSFGTTYGCGIFVMSKHP